MLLTITKSYKKVSFIKRMYLIKQRQKQVSRLSPPLVSVAKKLRFEKTEKQILFKE